jgi:4-hydroxybenzoate polyprenyltransferase and related prenyltransferases
MKVNMLLNAVVGGCSLFSFILMMLMNDMSFAFQSSQANNLSHRGVGVLWNNIGKHHRQCGGLYQISAISTNTIGGGKKMTKIVTPPNHALLSSSYLASHRRRRHHHRCKKSQLNVADVTTSGIAVSDEDEPSGGEKTAPAQQNKTKRDAFPLVLWRFTRPHTLIGSALAIPALHILAAPTYQQAFSTAAATSTLFAMIPSLLMNLYITGLNQITDVEIDKINKPQLPIAAGDLSIGSANVIVIMSLILSLAMGMVPSTLGSQGLNVALWGSGILGTLYSLSPFRLKRFPLLAAFCIVAVRGAVINAGFFAHAMTAAYGVETTVLDCLRNNARCLLSSLFLPSLV